MKSNIIQNPFSRQNLHFHTNNFEKKATFKNSILNITM